MVPYNELTGDLKTAADEEKIIAVLEETIDGTKKTAVVPKGYEVSTTDGEDSISAGLVIYDGTAENRNNEFVWIPVGTNFTEIYNASDNWFAGNSEPTELTESDYYSKYTIDSQENLNYWYGEGYYTYPQTEEEKLDVNNTFAYKGHYEEMVASVNKYDGFYIGRYETTIDEQGSIGSKADITVLKADSIIKTGKNANDNNNPYYYRWWGLYDTQRNTNAKGNKDYVQTNMIWGQQWDAMLTFIGQEQADSTILGSQSSVLKSGEATYDNNLKDEMNNIYDLRRNVYEWTALCDLRAGSGSARLIYAGTYDTTWQPPSYSEGYLSMANNHDFRK